jgi:hypothetical protein
LLVGHNFIVAIVGAKLRLVPPCLGLYNQGNILKQSRDGTYGTSVASQNQGKRLLL